MTWFTESLAWASGPWSLTLRGDEIADLRFEDRRVLRGIRAVVRDRDWATAPLVVDRMRETDTTLTMHVRSVALGSSFAGVVRVEARATGLVVLCDLESIKEFQTNRTGLVVLHPPQVAGASLAVTHSDGTVEASRFPVEIAPHQPVLDIADLSWNDEGVAVDVRFDGDVFEMEDQRNWTDASFKTYSRPLDRPFPYRVAAGERVRQIVTVRAQVTSDAPAQDHAPPQDYAPARIALRRAGVVPDVGVGAATAPDPAPAADPIGRFVMVELDLASCTWRSALARAAEGTLPLDVRLTLDPARPSELGAAVAALDGLRVARVGAFRGGDGGHVSDRATVDALRAELHRAGLRVPVVGGARSHFTQLNRGRDLIPEDLDGLAVTVTPLFHVLDTEQLVESIAIQRIVAEQTVAFAAGTPVHIGPISLRPRFNDVATAAPAGAPFDDLARGYGAELSGEADDRQSAVELAAWVVASAAALAAPGVETISWFEEWGGRGIRTIHGVRLPAADALEALDALAGGELLRGDSPDGLVWAIGSAPAPTGPAVVLVSNLDRHPRDVEILVDGERRPIRVEASRFVRIVVESGLTRRSTPAR